MSKKCLMLLAPDLEDAPLVVLVPAGRELGSELPDSLRGAVVVEVGDGGCHLRESGEEIDAYNWVGSSGWHVKMGDIPDAGENTLMDRTDWGDPEIRVIPSGETRPSQRCRLPKSEDEELIVGRSSRRAHLAIDDEHVSRRHLRFFKRDGKQMVADLDSRGGTFVNGERIQVPTELHHQDSIRIGNTTLEYFAFLEALDGLPEFEELSQPVEGGSEGRSERNEGEAEDPSSESENGDSGDGGGGGKPIDSERPLWDTVMYSMVILTVVIAVVVAWRVLA